MILLLDLGNTCLKWCVVDQQCTPDELLGSNAAQVSVLVSHRGFHEQLRQAIGGLENIRQIVFASVADQVLANLLQDWCESQWGFSVQRLHTTSEGCGVINCYRDYSQMGVDRWLAMLGAWVTQRRQMTGRMDGGMGGRMIGIVDAGSAITVDLLDSEGLHQGGVILSGRREVSELFPTHQAVIPETPFGRSTEECLALGRQLQESAEPLQWLIQRIERISPSRPTQPYFLVTGGDAETVDQAWGLNAQTVPNLVFMGMLAIIQSKVES